MRNPLILQSANTVLQDVPFLCLPDIVQSFGPVRATEHGLHISLPVQNWLRAGAPRGFHRTDLLQPWLQAVRPSRLSQTILQVKYPGAV